MDNIEENAMRLLMQILEENFEDYNKKWAILAKSDPKAPFSIATTLRCRVGCYSIPWTAPLYSWSLPYNAEG